MSHKVGESTLTHLETVKSDLFVSINDVLPTGKRSFYVTNDLSSRRGFLRLVEPLLNIPWSKVLYRDEIKGVKVVADGLVYANGIAASLNGKNVYVSSASGGMIYIFEKRRNNGLLLHEKVQLVSFKVVWLVGRFGSLLSINYY